MYLRAKKVKQDINYLICIDVTSSVFLNKFVNGFVTIYRVLKEFNVIFMFKHFQLCFLSCNKVNKLLEHSF